MKWVDRFTPHGLQAVLVDASGRDRAIVGATPITVGARSKAPRQGYPFMVGSKAGVYRDFVGAKWIAEKIQAAG